MHSYFPLGISCAAIALSDTAHVKFWQRAPQLTREECRAIVYELQQLVRSGYKIVTWNGCGFDFKVLAVESGLFNECGEMAINHIDLMLMVTFNKGWYLGLQKALKGAGLEGKRKVVTLSNGTEITDMDGAQVPKLWAAGEYKAVLSYLSDDVIQTVKLAQVIQIKKAIRWTSNNGIPWIIPVDKLLNVRECFSLPEPDVSWMNNPPTRQQFIEWILNTQVKVKPQEYEQRIRAPIREASDTARAELFKPKVITQTPAKSHLLTNSNPKSLWRRIIESIQRAQHTEIKANKAIWWDGEGANLAKQCNSIGMKFVLIPSGEFEMGSEDDAWERPVHKVKITKPFYLGKYPVTQREWTAIMGNNPSHFKGENLPVEQVSWDDVQEFIRKLNAKEGTHKYRLPSEAEWEYACRAGTTTRYSLGDSESNLSEYAWYDGNSGGKTHPVGQKKPNHWELYDMHGHVWEYVQDTLYDNYNSGPWDGTAREGSSYGRVIRGGCWAVPALYCTSAIRGSTAQNTRYETSSFRLVREV